MKTILLIFVAIISIIIGIGLDFSTSYFGYPIQLNYLKTCLHFSLIGSLILFLLAQKEIIKIQFNRLKYSSLLFVLIAGLLLTLGFLGTIRVEHENTWFTMGGIIPFSDAYSYYWELAKWPSKEFTVLSSWRPLNPIINLFIYFLAGKTLIGFLLIRIALLAIAIGCFLNSIVKYLGVLLSLSVGFILIDWAIPFTATYMTEINGLYFSIVGFTLLLESNNFEDKKLFKLGILFLIVANILRPFNYFQPIIFCSLILFKFNLSFSQKLKYFTIYSFVSLTLIFSIPKIINYWIGNQNADSNGNTGCVILGITRNTDWNEASNYIKNKYPKLDYKQINKVMQEEAAQTFKQNPKLTFYALWNSLKNSFLGLVKKLSNLFFQLNLKSSKSQLAFAILFLIGVIFLLRSRKINLLLKLILGLGLLSYFSFSPIVYNDGQWRVAATLFPIFSLVIPMFVFMLVGKKNLLINDIENSKTSATLLIKITSFLLISAFCYTIGSWTLGQTNNNYKKQSFTLYLEKDIKHLRIMDFNSAQTNYLAMANWMNYMANCGYAGFLPLKDYFTQNLEHIEAIKIYNGTYYIVTKPNSKLTELPDAAILDKWAPKFSIEQK